MFGKELFDCCEICVVVDWILGSRFLRLAARRVWSHDRVRGWRNLGLDRSPRRTSISHSWPSAVSVCEECAGLVEVSDAKIRVT